MKYANFTKAILQNVASDYRIAMLPLDAAEEAMILYQSAQDVFGVGAKNPNVKFAVTHVSGTVYEPDPTYANTKPHAAVCISMTVGDYGTRTALARNQGVKETCDLAHACQHLCTGMLARFSSSGGTEGMRRQGIMRPGRNISVRLAVNKYGANVIDYPQLSAGSDPDHVSMLRWERDMRGEVEPKIANVLGTGLESKSALGVKE